MWVGSLENASILCCELPGLPGIKEDDLLNAADIVPGEVAEDARDNELDAAELSSDPKGLSDSVVTLKGESPW